MRSSISSKFPSFSRSNSQSSYTAPDVNVAQDAQRLAEDAQQMLVDERYKPLVQYALMFIGLLAVLRVILSSLFILLIIVFPILYVYLLQTCPSPETFDAKKELKRVLRGHHLPEDHPDKPKGTIAKWTAKAKASVTAQVATLPGYQQSLTPIGGAVVWAKLAIPSSSMECHWVGALGKWHYVYSRELNVGGGGVKQD